MKSTILGKSLVPIIPVVFALILLIPPAAIGAEFVVDNVADLEAALVEADGNGQDDVIHIEAGDYSITSTLHYDSEENQDLTLQSSGGDVVLHPLYSQALYIWARGFNAHVALRGITVTGGHVTYPAAGGGIFVRAQAGGVTLENCAIIDNSASALYSGTNAGGAYIRNESSGAILIKDCVFQDNYAKGYGGGAYIIGGSDSTVSLINNIFVNNQASSCGGGLYINLISGVLTATNNTFTGNWNSSGNGYGGGAVYARFYFDGVVAHFYNNILWGNDAASDLGRDVFLEDDSDSNGSGATVNFHYNNLGDLDYEVGDNLAMGNNMDEDPLLDVDWRLTPDSPCIDAGLTAAPSAPDADFEGGVRCAPIDMGADEYCVGQVGITPGALEFGDIFPAVESEKTLTISNSGPADLSVTAMAISGADADEFALNVDGGGDPCGVNTPTLAPGAECTVSILFSPADVDAKTAVLEASSDDPETPLVQIPLAGSCSEVVESTFVICMGAWDDLCDDQADTVSEALNLTREEVELNYLWIRDVEIIDEGVSLPDSVRLGIETGALILQ